MTWLKVSDAFAMHPMLLHVLEFPEADDRILNEMAGFLIRCATSAAAYETDYVISQGMVQTLAGSHTRNKALTALAVRAGIFTEVEDRNKRRFYKLIEEEDLVHMIYKAERLWKNRQKQDNRNPKLTGPVRKRDGDECRWCGQIVNWSDRKSHKGGTYDHLSPGQGAASPEDMVVCCFQCNSERRNDAPSWNKTLRPVPETPYYSKSTVAFLAKINIHVKPSDSLSFEVADAKPTATLTPVEPAHVVDPASVEPTLVEPETLAPVAAGPEVTVPTANGAPGNETVTFRFEHMEEDLADAPDWVKEQLAESPPKHAEPLPADSGRFRQISTVTDLDLSGRVGTGREETQLQESSPLPENQGIAVSKPKRKRRRRRKKNTNGQK